jgi:hypothetical protein
MNTNEITLREMLNATIALLEGNTPQHNITPADVIAKAEAEIAKLDAINAKRAEKAKEKSAENKPIKDAIYHFLLVNGMKTTAEIAAGVEVLGGSSPKASAMCRQMVDEGRLNPHEVKVKGKGAQKAYTAIPSDEQGEDDPVQATDYELNTMF